MQEAFILGRVLFLFLLFWPLLSGADQKGYVAPLWGVSFPSTSSNVFSWGFQGAYKTSPIIGVGPYIQKYGIGLEMDSDEGSSIRADSSTSIYGAVLHVFLHGTLQGFGTGVKTGIVHVSRSASASNSATSIEMNDTMNKLFLAPRLCYEYPIGRFSAAVEVSYLYALGSNAPRVFSFLLTPRFRF